jgi:hypothetical protein
MAEGPKIDLGKIGKLAGIGDQQSAPAAAPKNLPGAEDVGVRDGAISMAPAMKHLGRGADAVDALVDMIKEVAAGVAIDGNKLDEAVGVLETAEQTLDLSNGKFEARDITSLKVGELSAALRQLRAAIETALAKIKGVEGGLAKALQTVEEHEERLRTIYSPTK